MNNFKDKTSDIELFYKTVDGVNLPMKVYLPQGDIKNAKTVVLIHGGGWNDAIKDNSEWNGGWMNNNAKYLAEKGFISIVISYRSLLISDSLNVGDLMDDCIDAFKYIKSHLKFVDFNNIICMGDSAGGYIATMMGLSQNDDIRPAVVIACNPVIDCTKEKWMYAFKGCKNIKQFLPFENIGKKCADFLFLHGNADQVVEIEDTNKLDLMIKEKGHSSVFEIVPDAKHAFILFDYRYSDEYVIKIMDKIINYIKNN